MKLTVKQLRKIIKEEVEKELCSVQTSDRGVYTESMESPDDKNPSKVPTLKAVINGVALTRAEETMLINSQGTFDAAKKVYTLKSGKAIPMDGDAGRLEARGKLLDLGDKRAKLKAAAGKGPKGKTAGQRAFAAWVMKSGYG